MRCVDPYKGLGGVRLFDSEGTLRGYIGEMRRMHRQGGNSNEPKIVFPKNISPYDDLPVARLDFACDDVHKSRQASGDRDQFEFAIRSIEEAVQCLYVRLRALCLCRKCNKYTKYHTKDGEIVEAIEAALSSILMNEKGASKLIDILERLVTERFAEFEKDRLHLQWEVVSNDERNEWSANVKEKAEKTNRPEDSNSSQTDSDGDYEFVDITPRDLVDWNEEAKEWTSQWHQLLPSPLVS